MFGTCIIGIFNIALILMGFGVIFTAFWLTDQNVIEHFNFSLSKHRIIFLLNRCINRFSFSFHLQIQKIIVCFKNSKQINTFDDVTISPSSLGIPQAQWDVWGLPSFTIDISSILNSAVNGSSLAFKIFGGVEAK